MAEFKPMVRMATSEPSAILKLKKGGKVAKDGNAEAGYKKMAGGGAMEVLATTPAFVGRPAVNAPVKAPGKPSMAKRRKAMEAKKMAPKKPAMEAKKPPMPMPEPKGMPMMPPMMPPMKKGGSAKGEMESKGEQRKEEKMDKAQDKAMVKKAFKQHDAQEHKGGKGTKLALKQGGQCYANGGEVTHKPLETPGYAVPRTENISVAKFANTMKRTATTNTNKAPTGGISKQNAGGYAMGGSVKTVVMSTDKKRPDNGFADGGSVLTRKTVKMVTAKKKADNGFAKGGTVGGSDVLHRQTVKMVTSKQHGYTAYAAGGVVDENDGGYKKGGSTKKAYAAGGTVENPIPMPQGNKPIPAPKRQINFSGVYKKGGEVAKKAMGGRMGQKPAQTIRTAPVGTSQATRDMFASKGKTPSYAEGGEVTDYESETLNRMESGKGDAEEFLKGQGALTDYERKTLEKLMKKASNSGDKIPKMAMGGMFNQFAAQAAAKAPVAAPMGGGVIAKAAQQAQSMPKQPPAPPRMQSNFVGKVLDKPAPPEPPKSNFVGKVLGKGMSGLKGAFGRKDGGKVENQPLRKINDEEDAPNIKASKTDVNLQYPETMNSPQKAPKLK
jgi:hypothetical protein